MSHLLNQLLLLPARDPSFNSLGDDLPELEQAFPNHAKETPQVCVELDLPADPRGTRYLFLLFAKSLMCMITASEAYKSLQGKNDHLEAQLKAKAREVQTLLKRVKELSEDKARASEFFQSQWDNERAMFATEVSALRAEAVAAKEAEGKAGSACAELQALLEARNESFAGSRSFPSLFVVHTFLTQCASLRGPEALREYL